MQLFNIKEGKNKETDSAQDKITSWDMKIFEGQYG